jgi:hypothetical protein
VNNFVAIPPLIGYIARKKAEYPARLKSPPFRRGHAGRINAFMEQNTGPAGIYQFNKEEVQWILI